MPLNFKPQRGSAIDINNGLVIYRPRILPAEAPDDIEYQYAIYRDDQPYDGLGLFGTDAITNETEHLQRVFTLDLGRDWVLDSIFGFKRALGSEDEDIDFLRGLARGLVAVFESRTDNDEELCYVAVTKAVLLIERGIPLPDDLKRSATGEIVLAEVIVPAHADGSNTP